MTRLIATNTPPGPKRVSAYALLIVCGDHGLAFGANVFAGARKR